MVTRIVKMTFAEEHIPAFLELFRANREAIASAEGCMSVELLRDIHKPGVMFTYSHWLDEKFIDLYKQSELFGRVWPETKRYFAAPAEVWTLEKE
jgi:heme oxygenase (mycobilin-producing)